jgi:hypothetical protein
LHRVAQRCMAGERTGHIATGMRGSRAGRQEPASLSLRESASLPRGELHPERGARALHLGRPQDSRAPAPQILRDPRPGQEHHPCGAGSSWTGRAPRSRASACAGNSLYRLASVRMSSGAPITRASSCWEITHTAYPARVTDHASRYLLTRAALSSLKGDYAFTVLSGSLRSVVCPPTSGARTACPSLSAHSLFNLSKVQLEQTRRLVFAAGHWIERIKPGHAQQDGRHERIDRRIRTAVLVRPLQHLLAGFFSSERIRNQGASRTRLRGGHRLQTLRFRARLEPCWSWNLGQRLYR